MRMVAQEAGIPKQRQISNLDEIRSKVGDDSDQVRRILLSESHSVS